MNLWLQSIFACVYGLCKRIIESASAAQQGTSHGISSCRTTACDGYPFQLSSVHIKTLIVRADYDIIVFLVARHVHTTCDLRRINKALVRQLLFVEFSGQRGQQ